MEITRKILAYMSRRPITTVNNWADGKAIMPEHVEKAKKEVEDFIDKKRKEIKKFEDNI